jgi:endonuclease/exonuclease/phosphatase family metal-dependent hydrolase
MLNVHMKSGCFVDNFSRSDRTACTTFAQQAPVLDAWIERREAIGTPYIVLGDFNHRISAPYNHLTRMMRANTDGSSSSLTIATKELIGCHPWYPAPIDHVVLGHFDKRLQLAAKAYDFEDMTVENMLSDHCAVTLSINTP